MKYYHISRQVNLDLKGIEASSETTVTKNESGWIYLGTLKYIKTQYLKYAPKGTYFLYSTCSN